MAKIKLEDIALKMNQQNHRGTQFPIFVIQEKKKIITHDDFGDTVQHYGDEGEEIEEKDLCEKCKEEIRDCGGCLGYIQESCSECGYTSSYSVKEEWVFNLYHGVFLTGEECDQYIQDNKHHFENDTQSFVIGTKSEELRNVLEYVSSASPSGLETHYRIN